MYLKVRYFLYLRLYAKDKVAKMSERRTSHVYILDSLDPDLVLAEVCERVFS